MASWRSDQACLRLDWVSWRLDWTSWRPDWPVLEFLGTHLGDFSMRFYRLSMLKFDLCSIQIAKGTKATMYSPIGIVTNFVFLGRSQMSPRHTESCVGQRSGGVPGGSRARIIDF